jgi:hypothetical protein
VKITTGHRRRKGIPVKILRFHIEKVPSRAGHFGKRDRFRVAQIFNLLYRRITFCGILRGPNAFGVGDACRLQIGDTAAFNSALRTAGGAG